MLIPRFPPANQCRTVSLNCNAGTAARPPTVTTIIRMTNNIFTCIPKTDQRESLLEFM